MKVCKQRLIYCGRFVFSKFMPFNRDFQGQRIGTTTYPSALNIC
jgi:hypothetical protein